MRWYAAVVAAGAVACGDQARPAADAQPAPDAQPLPSSVDILFVIGTSIGTVGQQEAITLGFPSLVASLEAEIGTRPSVHIGVISADLGVGDNEVFNCTASGDGAALQAAPQIASCTPPTDAFIRDEITDAGERAINYPEGMLDETFACIARLGDMDCSFEQPLEAMRLALGDHPASAGFRRPRCLARCGDLRRRG